jgi:hypothetical protein
VAIPLKSFWLTLALFFRDQVEDLLAQRIVGIGGFVRKSYAIVAFGPRCVKGRD